MRVKPDEDSSDRADFYEFDVDLWNLAPHELATLANTEDRIVADDDATRESLGAAVDELEGSNDIHLLDNRVRVVDANFFGLLFGR